MSTGGITPLRSTWVVTQIEGIVVPGQQGLANQRLLAATAHLLARVTEASIAEWQTEDEGDACRAYLANLGRQDATVRAGAAAQRAQTSAPEPPTEPADLVAAFWTLSRALKEQGVNVAQVAHDAVAGLTPRT